MFKKSYIRERLFGKILYSFRSHAHRLLIDLNKEWMFRFYIFWYGVVNLSRFASFTVDFACKHRLFRFIRKDICLLLCDVCVKSLSRYGISLSLIILRIKHLPAMLLIIDMTHLELEHFQLVKKKVK